MVLLNNKKIVASWIHICFQYDLLKLHDYDKPFSLFFLKIFSPGYTTVLKVALDKYVFGIYARFV